MRLLVKKTHSIKNEIILSMINQTQNITYCRSIYENSHIITLC